MTAANILLVDFKIFAGLVETLESQLRAMTTPLDRSAAQEVSAAMPSLPQLSSFSNKGVLLFKSGSASELASCITRVLTDIDYAIELSTEARKLAEKEFDWSRTVSMTSQLCERLASQAQVAG